MIWLGVWKQGLGGLSQTVLAILGQLCVSFPPFYSIKSSVIDHIARHIQALVPFSIVARVGLRLAFNGQSNYSGFGSKSERNPGSSATLEFRARSGNTSGSAPDTVTELKDGVWKERSHDDTV
jgi:hypothetical protein